MFKKPLSNQLRFAPLRSSDRRKLAAEIALLHPQNSQQQDEQTSSLPNKVSQAKWIAHGDVAFGTLYVNADDSRQPVWFRVEDWLVPTVYTLWNFPDMLPQIPTWRPVFEKLMGGADLMLPGFAVPLHAIPDLKPRDLVSIVEHGSSVPLAVGYLTIATSDIKQMKGKGVHILHVYKDNLWSLGDKSNPPASPPNQSIPSDTDSRTENDPSTLSDEVSSMTMDSKELELEDEPSKENDEPKQAEAERVSHEDMERYFQRSLLQALSGKIDKDAFPIMASAFYSNYMIPCRPFGTNLDIKHTKWKKLSKFLKDMEKEKILKVKDVRGELHIQSVDWKHATVVSFVPHKPAIASSPSSATTDQGSMPSTKSASAGSKKPLMQLIPLYQPKGNNIPLFQGQKRNKDDVFTFGDLRDFLNEYIREHDLVDKSNLRMVTIDAILCDAILEKEEYQSVRQLQRDVLVTRLIDKMQPYHKLVLPDKEPIVRKGDPRPIQILTARIQGNKVSTRVTGLETFLITPQDAAKELTKICACSVAVTTLPGKTKEPMMEVMIQGPQEKAVCEYLLARGIPKSGIQVQDKTKKK